MKLIVIEVPDELAERMNKYPNVDWPAVCRDLLEKHLNMKEGHAYLEKISRLYRLTKK